jgi:D-serine deaminase-like pyridoxal phosphate-dependent protein
MFPKNTKPPAIGSKVSVVPNHVCIAVNLVAELYLKQPNGSLKKVSVSARGKNS